MNAAGTVHSGRRATFTSRRRPFLRRPAPERQNPPGPPFPRKQGSSAAVVQNTAEIHDEQTTSDWFLSLHCVCTIACAFENPAQFQALNLI